MILNNVTYTLDKVMCFEVRATCYFDFNIIGQQRPPGDFS